MVNEIKAIRTQYGLTQEQLSIKLGIPKRTIENWEGGSRTPPEYVVKLIAHYMETTASKTEEEE